MPPRKKPSSLNDIIQLSKKPPAKRQSPFAVDVNPLNETGAALKSDAASQGTGEAPVENAQDGGTTVVAFYHHPGTTATTTSSGSSGTTAKDPAPPHGPVIKQWSRPNLEQINLKIPKQFAQRFDMWCFQNHTSKAEAFMRAIGLLFDGGGTTPSSGSSGSGGTTSLIDDYKTDDDIVVSLYQELTGNKWTSADKQFLAELRAAKIPTDRIECGIVISVFRCPTKVGSFRYCHGAISEVDESGMQETRLYVQRAKTKIAQKEKAKEGRSSRTGREGMR